MSALFAAPRMEVHARVDGSVLMRSADPLRDSASSVGAWLEEWALRQPGRSFLVQRDEAGAWEHLSYGEAHRRVYAVASWLLLNAQVRPGPVAALSDNNLDHAVLMLAAMHVGIPVAAVSTAYSLASKDNAKLRSLIQELAPGVVYVSDAGLYGPALRAIAPLHRGCVVARRNASADMRSFASLLETAQPDAVQRAFDRVSPDTVAKILYTSGSTGSPKGVLNTQRMLCSNQQAKAQIWPFLETTPPVILDWLPWNHTFGANHNFNMVLRNGGTLYIDGGRPMPGLFDTTLANLREVAPTLYFNVPRGYDMLVGALRADAGLRRHFFSRLQLLFYAAAALPQNLWDDLQELSREATGREIPLVSAWGTTETAPLATDCHFQAPRSGNIGVPIPGTELKLVPAARCGGESAYEIRVRGPNITPGYFKSPEQTAKAFDEEGYYLTGDAVRFADPQKPEAGLTFGGRISEDFKLSTGTWVNVGSTRIRALECLAPLAQDIVVAGHDRDHIAFLVFPNLAACRQLAGLPADATAELVLGHPVVREAARAGLGRLRSLGGGSSMVAPCCLLLGEPPNIDAGEITDKGYINQGAVLGRRADRVAALFAPDRGDSVICV